MDSKLKITLVEDHDALRELTAEVLRSLGHEVVALSCAEEIEEISDSLGTEVFLIDLNLPGEDGLSLVQRIRKTHEAVGIIIMSARTDLDSKVSGYDLGADLYLPKPVQMAELQAALRRYVKRRQIHRQELKATAEALRLYQSQLEGPLQVVQLTQFERQLLAALARAPANRLENWQIMSLFSGQGHDLHKSSLEVRISRLRKKLLQAGSGPNPIEPIRSIGYQLNSAITII